MGVTDEHLDSFLAKSKIMVFRPTMSEFSDFSKYVEYMEECGAAEFGVAKIIPPAEWKPCKNLARKVKKKKVMIGHPVQQQISSTHPGIYQQMNIEQHPLDLEAFEEMALSDDFKPPTGSLEFLEQRYWRGVTFKPPIYGADVEGSFYDKSVKEWNVPKLGDVLDEVTTELGVTIPGVNSPYLYFGMWKTTFPWHVEDMDLYSINYLHYGEPKFWYAIPQSHAKRFETMIRGMYPEFFKVCPEFLRHKMTLVSPKSLRRNGIPFNKMVQRDGEFMITFPSGYHSGFNMGYNAAESVNFALHRWVEIGKKSKFCVCYSDTVSINMDSFVDGYNYLYDKDIEKCTPRPAPKKTTVTPVNSEILSRMKSRKKLSEYKSEFNTQAIARRKKYRRRLGMKNKKLMRWLGRRVVKKHVRRACLRGIRIDPPPELDHRIEFDSDDEPAGMTLRKPRDALPQRFVRIELLKGLLVGPRGRVLPKFPPPEWRERVLCRVEKDFTLRAEDVPLRECALPRVNKENRENREGREENILGNEDSGERVRSRSDSVKSGRAVEALETEVVAAPVSNTVDVVNEKSEIDNTKIDSVRETPLNKALGESSKSRQSRKRKKKKGPSISLDVPDSFYGPGGFLERQTIQDDTTPARKSKFNDLYDSIVSPVKQKLSLEDLFEMGKQRKYGPLDFMWHPQQAGSSKQPRIFLESTVPENSRNNMDTANQPDQDEVPVIRDMGRGWSPPAPSLWSRKPSSPAPQSEVVWKPLDTIEVEANPYTCVVETTPISREQSPYLVSRTSPPYNITSPSSCTPRSEPDIALTDSPLSGGNMSDLETDRLLLETERAYGGDLNSSSGNSTIVRISPADDLAHLGTRRSCGQIERSSKGGVKTRSQGDNEEGVYNSVQFKVKKGWVSSKSTRARAGKLGLNLTEPASTHLLANPAEDKEPGQRKICLIQDSNSGKVGVRRTRGRPTFGSAGPSLNQEKINAIVEERSPRKKKRNNIRCTLQDLVIFDRKIMLNGVDENGETSAINVESNTKEERLEPAKPAKVIAEKKPFNCPLFKSGRNGDVADTHSDEKRFSCRQCHYKSERKSSLTQHMKLAHSEKIPFACPHCPYKYISKSNLNEHIKQVHSEEKPFACSLCPYKCKRKSVLITHQLRHSENKPFSCSQCPYKSKLKRALRRHQLTVHSEEKPFSGSQCPYKCEHKMDLSMHQVLQSQEKPFICLQCPYKCKRRKNLSKHTKQVHQEGNPFSCSKCAYKFKRNCHLKDHIRGVHSEEKPFACSQCPYKCKRKSDLSTHQVIHSEEKPFICTQCSYKSKRKRDVIKHTKQAHQEEKPFSCSKCEYKCKSKGNLNGHTKLVHSEEKPFACVHCARKFTKNGHLKDHIREVHSKEKPFACSRCPYSSKRKRDVKRHQLTVHSA